MSELKIQSFLSVFVISIAMIYADFAIASVLKLLGVCWHGRESVVVFIFQVLSFIAGGAVVGKIKDPKSEWYLFFSFALVGAIYLGYLVLIESRYDYDVMAIYADLFFDLIFGLFVAGVSHWLVKRRYIN